MCPDKIDTLNNSVIVYLVSCDEIKVYLKPGLDRENRAFFFFKLICFSIISHLLSQLLLLHDKSLDMIKHAQNLVA